MTEVKCRISTVSMIKEDTLFIDIASDQKFDVEDFNELKNAALSLGSGKSFYNLIKVGPFTLPTKKAREASCSIEGSYYKKADAFIVSTLPQKIMARLMCKINKPVVPTRFFDSVQQAERWFEKLKSSSKLEMAH